LLGTSLGTAIGLGFGWAIMHAAAAQGLHAFTVPVVQLTVIVLAAALAAVAAAALPARRAARLDMLRALNQ